MSTVSLAIIATDHNHRRELAGIIGTLGSGVDILASTPDFAQGVGQFRENPPHIVILDVLEVGQGVKETAALVSQFPDTAVFVTCGQKDPDWILSLIRAGAGEYLTKPVDAAELVEAVKKAMRLHWQGEEKRGRLVSVYNPTGGMGTSTIAVNLAVALAAQGEGVALIDLNPLSPDISAFLDLAPRYNLGTVLSRDNEIDGNFLKSLLTSHRSGIEVLAGGASFSGQDRYEAARTERLLAVSRTQFVDTVIDCAGALEGCNLSLFSESDLILYATVLSLPALKNAKRYLAEMAARFGGGKVKVVVNRYNAKGEIGLGDAERVLGCKPFAALPNAYSEVKDSINRGEPLVRRYPKSQFARAIAELSGRVKESQLMLQKGV
jgi:pilus assembly protein CpaE